MGNKKGMKALILAGGSGSRLMPFTKYTHKTLLPIYDKPVIDYVLYSIRNAGIDDITIVANRHIEQIVNHIGEGLEGEKIRYVLEKEPNGVDKALELARSHVEGSRLMLYFADNITTYDFQEDVNNFIQSDYGPGTILLARKVDNPQDFGVCEFDQNGEFIINIIEKPNNPPSNLAIGGIYLFDESFWIFFDQVTKENKKFSISDITRKYVKASNCKIRNIGDLTWVDCGTPDSLNDAGNLVRSQAIIIRNEI